MRSIFVFFHIGRDIEIPRMLVSSIRTNHPDARIIQCTDLTTPKVEGVTSLQRHDGNSGEIMQFRVEAFALLGLSEPAIYMDTDMLVVKPLNIQKILEHKEVMLCERSFERELLHTGSQRGVEFPEHRGRKLGEVFPFLACVTITRNSSFWTELLEILRGLDERFKRWYGDQEAMRIWSESSPRTLYGTVKESEYACLPEQSFYLNQANVIHFKGAARKAGMLQAFEAVTHRRQSLRDQYSPLRDPPAGRRDYTYVIMTPPPNLKSAGITYLNSLADYLHAIGKKVARVYAVYPGGLLHVWNSQEIPKHNHWKQPWNGSWLRLEDGGVSKLIDSDNCIVIHGENQHHRWFDGCNVVRYYLHRIDALQKKGVPRSGEFKLAWHPMFCKDADFILRKSLVRFPIEDACTLDLSSRMLSLTYVGKGWMERKNYGRIPGTIEITREWPNNDDEYFYLLSNARIIYTYDAATSVLDDAIVMGVMPVIMTTYPFSKEEWVGNLEPEMHGCYCFPESHNATAYSKFINSRQKYIQFAANMNKVYLTNLLEFCNQVERKFSTS